MDVDRAVCVDVNGGDPGGSAEDEVLEVAECEPREDAVVEGDAEGERVNRADADADTDAVAERLVRALRDALAQQLEVPVAVDDAELQPETDAVAVVRPLAVTVDEGDAPGEAVAAADAVCTAVGVLSGEVPTVSVAMGEAVAETVAEPVCALVRVAKAESEAQALEVPGVLGLALALAQPLAVAALEAECEGVRDASSVAVGDTDAHEESDARAVMEAVAVGVTVGDCRAEATVGVTVENTDCKRETVATGEGDAMGEPLLAALATVEGETVLVPSAPDALAAELADGLTVSLPEALTEGLGGADSVAPLVSLACAEGLGDAELTDAEGAPDAVVHAVGDAVAHGALPVGLPEPLRIGDAAVYTNVPVAMAVGDAVMLCDAAAESV